MFDLPPAFNHNEIPPVCVVQTMHRYSLPPALLIGYLGQEGGRVGMANRNSNGSYDYGPAQVNSIWLKTLASYGVTASQLQHDPCINLWVSGWIMRRCLDKFQNDFWLGVGCYHAGEYPSKPVHYQRMRSYAGLVIKRMNQYKQPFSQWLMRHDAGGNLAAR